MPSRTRSRKPIRLFIADGQTLFREGLRRLIDASHNDIVVVGEASNGRDAVREISRVKPDILVLDLVLSQLNGMEVLRRIAPLGLPTLILTADIKDQDMKRAVQLKASAVLPKQSPFEELIRCIRLLDAGKTWSSSVDSEPPRPMAEPSAASTQHVRIHITKREREIIGAISAGCSNKEIARRLLISNTTVKHYIQNIFNKTGTSNRIELLYFAIQNRLGDDTSGASQAVDGGGALGGAETA
jgi:DNA-binding NarL/FixJ family response regulator